MKPIKHSNDGKKWILNTKLWVLKLSDWKWLELHLKCRFKIKQCSGSVNATNTCLLYAGSIQVYLQWSTTSKVRVKTQDKSLHLFDKFKTVKTGVFAHRLLLFWLTESQTSIYWNYHIYCVGCLLWRLNVFVWIRELKVMLGQEGGR